MSLMDRVFDALHRRLHKTGAAVPQAPSAARDRFERGARHLAEGDPATAIELLGQAIALRQADDDFLPDAQLLLARAHGRLGDLPSAWVCVTAARKQRPEFEEALREGVEILRAMQRPAEALEWAQHLDAIRPSPDAGVLVAQALHQGGRSAEALEKLDAVLRLDPQHAEALRGRDQLLLAIGRAEAERLIGVGNAREDADDAAGALECYREALERAPELPKAHLNLGICLAAQGDHQGAAAAYASGLALDPADPFLNYNAARLRYLQGDLAGAHEGARRALSARPAFVQALVLSSNALDDLGETGQALEAIGAAIELEPAMAGAHWNRARMLRKLRRTDDALLAARRAEQLDPDGADVRLLASLYAAGGFAREALSYSEMATGGPAVSFHDLSRALFFANYSEDSTPESLLAAHRDYGRRLEAQVPAAYVGRWHGSTDPGRRIRVGFVSGDLFHHPVGMFLVPLLEHLDQAQFEVTCYSSVPVPDAATQRLRSLAAHWRETAEMADAPLAELVHRDGIDVLIDLSGHSGTSRLAVFAERPAPVQLTWLGYLNTTGLTRIDARLCDARTDPPEAQKFHSEQLLHLPGSQWCYRPFTEVPPCTTAPHARNGFVTFGSFSNAAKVSDAMCRRWAQLMARCPGSRMLLVDISSELRRQAIRDVFSGEGILPERLEFEPHAGLVAYYRLYDKVDIALDAFPYGGATTTLDALWMGVPVLALRGELPVSRSASSILTLLGLEQWIAPAPQAYVEIAASRAADLESLQRLRSALRPMLQRSVLMDEPGFARGFGAALRAAWVRHCAATESS